MEKAPTAIPLELAGQSVFTKNWQLLFPVSLLVVCANAFQLCPSQAQFLHELMAGAVSEQIS